MGLKEERGRRRLSRDPRKEKPIGRERGPWVSCLEKGRKRRRKGNKYRNKTRQGKGRRLRLRSGPLGLQDSWDSNLFLKACPQESREIKGRQKQAQKRATYFQILRAVPNNVEGEGIACPQRGPSAPSKALKLHLFIPNEKTRTLSHVETWAWP